MKFIDGLLNGMEITIGEAELLERVVSELLPYVGEYDLGSESGFSDIELSDVSHDLKADRGRLTSLCDKDFLHIDHEAGFPAIQWSRKLFLLVYQEEVRKENGE